MAGRDMPQQLLAIDEVVLAKDLAERVAARVGFIQGGLIGSVARVGGH